MREVPEAMGAMNRDIATRVLVIASFIKTLYIDLRYRPDKPISILAKLWSIGVE